MALQELRALHSTSSLQRLATIGDTGDPVAQPCFLSAEALVVLEIGGGVSAVKQDPNLSWGTVGSKFSLAVIFS